MLATISFKIRPGQKEQTPIYLIFSYGRRNELRYSTGWKVLNPKNWDKGRQRVRNVVAEPSSNHINEALKKLETFFLAKYFDLKKSNIEITNKALRNELDIYLKKRSPKKSVSSYKNLIECYEFYYEHFSKNPLPTTKSVFSDGTVRSYKTSHKLLKEFNESVYSINYDRITLNFYYDYLEFLRGKNYSNNYISKQIKNLKTIMNFAWERKFHSNLDFKLKAFTKIPEQVNHIYLNQEEIERINALSLTGKIDIARDLFIVACNSGLRVSDFNRLTSSNIKNYKGSKYIEIETKKTKSIVAIPVNRMINRVLTKYNGNPPPYMVEQKINGFLKTIGSRAGIKEKVFIKRTEGGKLITKEHFKYNLISCHTARRSFCTNAYKSGMPTLDIMAISGHKTERSFYNYIKISDLERLEKISKHPFFN